MKNLCRAIIWSACFLEMSGEDTIDPDSAVKALEALAATMQAATEEEKRAFIEVCAKEADQLQLEGTPGQAKTAEFIRSLPEAMGLVSPEK